MDDSIPTVTTTATDIPPVLDADNLIKVFTHFLSFDVADGAASAETIIAYWSQVKAYLQWCQQQAVDPAAASRETIKVYRHYLGVADKSQNPYTEGDRSCKKSRRLNEIG